MFYNLKMDLGFQGKYSITFYIYNMMEDSPKIEW